MGDGSYQRRDPYTLPLSEDRWLPNFIGGLSYSSPHIISTFGLLLSLESDNDPDFKFAEI